MAASELVQLRQRHTVSGLRYEIQVKLKFSLNPCCDWLFCLILKCWNFWFRNKTESGRGTLASVSRLSNVCAN